MIKFTQITDRLKYPPNLKSTLMPLHADIISYVMSNFKNNNKYRKQ